MPQESSNGLYICIYIYIYKWISLTKSFYREKHQQIKLSWITCLRDQAGDKNGKVKKRSEMLKTRKEKKVPEIYKSI